MMCRIQGKLICPRGITKIAPYEKTDSHGCLMLFHANVISLKGCHFVSFVMHIYGAKFQEHYFNISRDIVN